MRSSASDRDDLSSGEIDFAGGDVLHWRAQHSGSVAELSGARTSAERDVGAERFTFSHDELSPDGMFHICYGYTRRGHEALVIEPLISLSATGEVLVNLWRSGLTGWAESFNPEGFRLIVSDPYGTSHLEVAIDLKNRRFHLPTSQETSRPLHELRTTLIRHVAQVRRNTSAFQQLRLREQEAEYSAEGAGFAREIQRAMKSAAKNPETDSPSPVPPPLPEFKKT